MVWLRDGKAADTCVARSRLERAHRGTVDEQSMIGARQALTPCDQVGSLHGSPSQV